ncbi:hypothetical protein PanWU01x14_004860 [Parasponia andersonii]|uniref:Endonuclease/exonuclease/phosphatase n=1 Tax=Parasponia andersonii TaxID=3476 RepID=A0A2P5E3A9_PARAD|nr:hypothetical protein PanWU01x14_004860 [Parasponia andersonii]
MATTFVTGCSDSTLPTRVQKVWVQITHKDGIIECFKYFGIGGSSCRATPLVIMNLLRWNARGLGSSTGFQTLWNLIRSTIPIMLCVGDFNQVFYLKEKQGGNDIYFNDMRNFRNIAEECDLIDLIFFLPGIWGELRMLMSKKDWNVVLGVLIGNAFFQMLKFFMKTIGGSDHRALKIVLHAIDITVSDSPKRRFYTEPWWLSTLACREVISDSWTSFNIRGSSSALIKALGRCRESLKAKSSSTYGRIPKMLKSIQNERSCYYNNGVHKGDNCIKLLEKKGDKLLELEEYYKKQRSRV